MRLAILAAMLFALAASAGTADLYAEVGTGFAMGGWGENFDPGFNLGLGADWRLTSKFRTGAGFDISSFSHSHNGDVTLFMLRPSIRTAFYFNPRSSSFNPGIAAAFGMCRTELESGGGVDTPTWDPFWRAGIRWDLSLGRPWRANLGLDLESVMASEKTGDTFRLSIAVSREVQL